MIMHVDVTTVGPAERLKRLAESRGVPLSLRIVRAPHPYRDLPFRPVLLRVRSERPRSCSATDKGDEFPPPHGTSPPAETSGRAKGYHISEPTVVASRLGKPPSYVAKYEGGDRRLDALEFLDVAAAIGFDPCRLIRTLTKK